MQFCRIRRLMIDDSATKNTGLLDREFIPKTEHLDLQSLVQQICDSHKFDYTSIIIILIL